MTDPLRPTPRRLTVSEMRYGSDAPLPERRTLRAGNVTCVLERSDLRYISVGGVEVVRRVYVAVRNRNWDTIDATFPRFAVEADDDSFHVDFDAEHVLADVDFAWTGSIVGDADGTITYTMRGAPRSDFLRNRIGFCVLHPMMLAGAGAVVQTPSGRVDARFPIEISPDQPFIDMQSISHPVGGNGSCEIRFSGDLFETEDQRNWTDASYKTYGTPLRLPYPVLVRKGDLIEQAVDIRLSGSPPKALNVGDSAFDVRVGAPIGPMPEIGFAANVDGPDLDSFEIERLQQLWPAHLWASLDLSGRDWRSSASSIVRQGEALRARIDVSVAGIDATSRQVASELVHEFGGAITRLAAFPPVDANVTFPRRDLDTSAEALRIARDVVGTSGQTIAVGGGTRAYFTELNRAAGRLPINDMDFATYTINPQVHAFDNASIVETLAAQSATIGSARSIVGPLPLVVGPVSLRPTFNPNATGPQPAANETALPENVDPRQVSLFAAGWTVGSLNSLSAGTAALTFYELTGRRGLMSRSGGEWFGGDLWIEGGRLYPVYHVFSAVAELRSPEVLQVDVEDQLKTAAVGLRDAARRRILIANLTSEDREVVVSALMDAGEWRAVVLDDRCYAEAGTDPEFFRHPGITLDADDALLRVNLRPFAIACLTAANA